MSKYLIIGYGNTLRSDDGAGRRVAEIVASWQLPDVRSLSVHQLTPELSADLAEVELAIFVDAAVSSPENSPQMQLMAIKASYGEQLRGHHTDPRSLLALAETLYDHAPDAWWLLIPSLNLDFGEQFSEITNQGIVTALDKIRQIIAIAEGRM